MGYKRGDLWDAAGENNYSWAICSWRLSWTVAILCKGQPRTSRFHSVRMSALTPPPPQTTTTTFAKPESAARCL